MEQNPTTTQQSDILSLTVNPSVALVVTGVVLVTSYAAMRFVDYKTMGKN